MKKYVFVFLSYGLVCVSNAETIDVSSIFSVDGIAQPLNPIISPFGPRDPEGSGSRFHEGLDLVPGTDGSKIITAKKGGVITHISKENSNGGNRIYVNFGSTEYPKEEFGFGHLFYDQGNDPVTKSGLTLARIMIPFRIKPFPEEIVPCDVIFNKAERQMLFDQRCPLKNGRLITYNNTIYTATNKVSPETKIGVVGKSQTNEVHLHLFYMSPAFGAKKSPLYRLLHSTPNYDAFFSQNPSTTTKEVNPSFDQADLPKYVWLNVETTAGNDFENVTFFVDGNAAPIASYSLGGIPKTSATPLGISPAKCNHPPYTNCKIQLGNNTVPSADSVYARPTEFEENYRKYLAFGIQIPSGLSIGPHVIKVDLTSVNKIKVPLVPKEIPFQVTSNATRPLVFKITSSPGGWSGVPATITVADLYLTAKSSFEFQGTQGNTCGTGERGSPLFSSQVDFDAQFFGAPTVTGIPTQIGAGGVNRRPCSSFYAKKVGANDNSKVWINATGRAVFGFGGFVSDWEYQVRYYSGDPATNYADRSCLIGTVPNAGFFSNATPVTCEIQCDQRIGNLPGCYPAP